ncbi:disease resistance protein RGA2-like [Panicum miliaceum]|uniref:Disease resistance protein RGA2-like n=1 Tax=Panicum miliaceum TaxID=4540 RepID=A0A3L6QXN6_PANMI|nr:disease resistance protein RGA2-like [Panicum miliaceum]
METFVSAVLGDLLSRSISFIFDRCYRQQKDVGDYLLQLHRVLLRIQATMEEAEGRHITNKAMLRQLQMLREMMYKGCYLLDTFTYQVLQQHRDNDQNCMFGRQAEMEKIISFLLQPEPPGAESLQVLPITGPARVGKSTLVEHLCYDERVRNHFSTIILCSGDSTAPEGSGAVKKRTHGSHGRSLIIMELADDLVLDERQCRNFYSSRNHMPPGSKIIVTRRSENIIKLGTTGAIKLDFLSREAYWYFFKVMAFGSTNPADHPELASIAMEIAAGLERCFVGAHVICGFLRANMHRRFWNKILECQRNNIDRNIRIFGEHPLALIRKKQTAYVWSLSNMSMRVKVLYCQTHSTLNDVPKIALHEAQTSAKARGKLEALVLKSRIPPYHSYSMTCEFEVPQDMMTKKKRPRSYLEI